MRKKKIIEENIKAQKAGIRYGMLAAKLIALPAISRYLSDDMVQLYLDFMEKAVPIVTQGKDIKETVKELDELREQIYKDNFCWPMIDIEKLVSIDPELGKYFPKEE